MPNNAVTYNQIVNRFRYFAEVHQLINGNFFHVRVNEADMQKAEGSPFMIVTPTSINRENGQVIVYGFEVRIMQLPKHDGENEEYEVEVLSDTAQMVEDLLAAIKYGYVFGDNVTVRDGSSSAVDWIDKHLNVGWAVTLSIEVPKNLDACDIPGDFDFVTGGSASGGIGASIYMLKSVYDTDGDGIVDYAAQIEGIGAAGNSKYYGTNSLGVPGFYDLPSGGGLPDGDYGAFTVNGGVALLNNEVVDSDQVGHRAITNEKLDHMAPGTVKGRSLGGVAGSPEDLTPDQQSAILDTATDPFLRTSDADFDPSGSAASALSSANAYTDAEISALNLNGLREQEFHSAPQADTIAASTTSYLYFEGAGADATTESGRQNLMLKKLTLTKMGVLIRTTQSATGALRITLRINGVDSALTVNIPAGSLAGSYLATVTVDVAANDLLSWKVQNLATTASAAISDIAAIGVYS